MLTGVVALLLAIAAVVPAAGHGQALSAAALPQRLGALPVSVSMTTVNDGRVVSLLDPAQTAWVHPAPTGAVAEVTATVELHGSPVHQWVAHLDTPDSFQGVTPGDCHGSEEAPPRQVSCRFAVQAASGPNRLQFRVIFLHLLMTIHAGLSVRKIRVRRDVDKAMTIAAIHPKLGDVNIVREWDGLDRLIAHTRVFRRDVIPRRRC